MSDAWDPAESLKQAAFDDNTEVAVIMEATTAQVRQETIARYLGCHHIGVKVGIYDELGDYYKGEITQITFSRSYKSVHQVTVYLSDKKSSSHLFNLDGDTVVQFLEN